MATPPHPNKHPSVNHTNPHASLLMCEALSHTLSHPLHFGLSRQRHDWWVCSHTPLIQSRRRCEGVSERKKKMSKTKKMKEFFLPFPSLSLSLSLLSTTFPFSLSLSLHFLHYSALVHSQYTQRPSIKEALTHCKCLSDITCIHDETHRNC